MNISVNGRNILMRGKVEARGAWLSVPNNPSTRRLVRLLTPQVEGQQQNDIIIVDGKPMPPAFILSVRAPRKIVQEG